MEPIKSKKSKVIVWSVIALAAVLLLGLVYVSQKDVSLRIKDFETATNNFFVQTIKSDALTPPPLRGIFGQPGKPLTDSGVLTWTNKNRQDAGATDLVVNATLTKMAKDKLNDLFDKQYFEHVSPTGVGPSDLAKKDGYDYIVIGENLALGNFNGDKALVDAWMASPGHRANILNVRYREIGIAVGQGTYEGKTTWIAVQEFGLPITACPAPSTKDQASINSMKVKVNTLELKLSTQKAAIDNTEVKYGDEYNSKVDTYNSSVHQYNAEVVALKALISKYNTQVSVFNACAEVVSTTTVEKI